MNLILLSFLEFCYYSNSLLCSLLLCLYLSVCLSTYLPICVFINHLTTLLRKELKIYFLFTNIQKTLLKWERYASSCPKGQHTLAVLTDQITNTTACLNLHNITKKNHHWFAELGKETLPLSRSIFIRGTTYFLSEGILSRRAKVLD